MSSVTLPTSITLTDGRTPKLIQTAGAITLGRNIIKNTQGKAEQATNSSVDRARVFGVALSGAFAAGQWIAYAEPGDRITGSGLTKGVAYYLDHGTDEVQTLTITGTPAGGTFKLSYGGAETASIAFDATGAQVATALALLSTIGTGNISGTGSSGGPFVLTFKNTLGAKDVALLTLSTNAFTGGTAPTLTPVETTPGAAAGNICPFADLVTGNVITLVGVAESTTVLDFDPIYTGATV